VLDPGDGPDDIITHTYCRPCAFVAWASIEKMKEPATDEGAGPVATHPIRQERMIA
jgi:hypothetical protein